ncbi:MAG: hypothetical protein ACSHX0_03630 [Akkermansiaceae bacterium]
MNQDATLPISVRKLNELSRETATEVESKTPDFCSLMTKNFETEVSKGSYSAMKTAVGRGAPYNGIGGKPKDNFTTLYHLLNAKSFYGTNIDPNWKDLTKKKLGPGATDEDVYAAWKEDVANGTSIPKDGAMLSAMKGSLASYPYAWWSPDALLNRPSCKDTAQGQQDFFFMCKLLALAPEWYSEGLVRITINISELKGNEAIRPSTFDGSTSPLWVQHCAENPAMTGGGALETLNSESITIGDLETSCQAYILPDSLSKDLFNSPSVDTYSLDLNEVSTSQPLGQEQKDIIEDVNRSRAAADQNFPFPSPLPDEIQNLIDLISTQSSSYQMAPQTNWKESMQEAGSQGLVTHRKYRFPFEPFQEILESSAEEQDEILTAAAELIEESQDPGVLNLVTSLQPTQKHQAYFDSLLNRFEKGSEIPSAQGISRGNLKEQMLWKLCHEQVVDHSDYRARAHAVLKDQQRHDIRLSLLNLNDPENEKTEVLQQAVTQAPDSLSHNLIAHLAFNLKGEQEDARKAAKTIKGLPQSLKKAFHAEIATDEIYQILDIKDEE